MAGSSGGSLNGFAEAFARGLLADAEYRRDLGPGPAIGSRLGDLVG
jgi:hypothetical protein